MKRADAERLAQQIATFYDPNVSLDGLKALLRSTPYTMYGDTPDNSPIKPFLRINLEEDAIALLFNPYYVRTHLKEKGWVGWIWIISMVQGYYSVTGSHPPYTGVYIQPCFIEGEMTLCGNVSLIN